MKQLPEQLESPVPSIPSPGWTLGIPLLTFLLALWGLLTILSSQSDSAAPTRLAERQLTFLLLGLAVMAAAAKIPFVWHRTRLLWVYIACSLGSLLLLPVFGVRLNGMQGWYAAGNYLIQPSEFGKAVFLLVLVRLAGQTWVPWKKFLMMTAVTLVWTLPILLQPDFGTAMVYFLTVAAVYYLAGGHWRWLLAGAGAIVLAGGAFIMQRPYALRRVLSFLNPELDPSGSGWHIRQFQLAIAHGGWFGEKLGRAYWSNAYLPLAYNDSAYATISETLGLIGALPVPLFFGLLCYLLFSASRRPNLTAEARIYLMGSATLIAIQALLHISVNVGLLPPTGLPLPLVSYGGSSLVASCLMIGIALSAIHDKSPRAAQRK